MCGRYSLNLEHSKSNFKKDTLTKFPKIFTFKNPDISPSSENPIIFFNNKEYLFELFKWGLSYDWLPKGRVLFNIRSETVSDKNFSKDLLLKKRCLVPFNSYFEWQNTPPSKKKFTLQTKEKFSYFAAVYREASEGNEYSILTKASAQNIKHIHERSPVIVPKEAVKKWFSDYYLDILNNSSVNINYSEV